MTTLETRAPTIVPLAGHLGAEVHGVNVGALSDADIRDLRDALYRVLFFPGQGLDPATHRQVLPEVGGDTLWSNQYAALDALSAPIREALYGPTGTHRIAPQPNVPEADHPW